MPTPDDAMLSPVEHESITNHPTCPPDESRIITPHTLHGTRTQGVDGNVDNAPVVPVQQPTPPPLEPPVHAQSAADSHSKPSGADIEVPSRDISTPMTATDDGTEEQRSAHVSSLSTTASVPVSLLSSHLSSPFPTHRVRGTPLQWIAKIMFG